jgi:HD-like signal output (HDOD) protein
VTLRFLAQQLPGLSEDLAYTYGLFTHVGLPVLLQSVRGYGSTLVEAAARIDRPFVATENANHGTDHAVVGALVARAWHLSPAVMSAIRLHHDLDTMGTQRVDAEVQTLMATGLLAESFVNRYEGLPEGADWRSHGSQALLWLGAGDTDLAAWEEQLSPLLDEA